MGWQILLNRQRYLGRSVRRRSRVRHRPAPDYVRPDGHDLLLWKQADGELEVALRRLYNTLPTSEIGCCTSRFRWQEPPITGSIERIGEGVCTDQEWVDALRDTHRALARAQYTQVQTITGFYRRGVAVDLIRNGGWHHRDEGAAATAVAAVLMRMSEYAVSGLVDVGAPGRRRSSTVLIHAGLGATGKPGGRGCRSKPVRI